MNFKVITPATMASERKRGNSNSGRGSRRSGCRRRRRRRCGSRRGSRS